MEGDGKLCFFVDFLQNETACLLIVRKMAQVPKHLCHWLYR